MLAVAPGTTWQQVVEAVGMLRYRRAGGEVMVLGDVWSPLPVGLLEPMVLAIPK